MFNYNAEIETLLKGLSVPVSFLFYDGDEETYVVYQQVDIESVLYGNDEIIGGVQYYDFDVYSKGNYLSVINELLEIMIAAGWTYTPSRNSPDLYERDTKYYHKTISLCKESEV